MKRDHIPGTTIFQSHYKVNGEIHVARTWTIEYHGKRESTGLTKYDLAYALLLTRLKEHAEGEHSSRPERVRMNQLFDLLIEDHKLHERHSLYDVTKRVDAHLRPYWGKLKAQDVGTNLITSYIERRKQHEAAAATVNKELAWLRRAMKLGYQHDPQLVRRVPHFPMLQVNNAREGTLNHEHYRAVRDGLPFYARIAFVIAYHIGARRGEITSLMRDKVAADLQHGRIHFPGRTTKNGAPKYVRIYWDMKPELDMWLTRIADSKCPYLIQDDGKRVHTFYKSWDEARKKAGVPETLFHDMRRTAACNMNDAGWKETEIMLACGWKTAAMLRRYLRVSERRMRENAAKLEELLEQKDREAEAVKKGELVRDLLRDGSGRLQ